MQERADEHRERLKKARESSGHTTKNSEAPNFDGTSTPHKGAEKANDLGSTNNNTSESAQTSPAPASTPAHLPPAEQDFSNTPQPEPYTSEEKAPKEEGAVLGKPEPAEENPDLLTLQKIRTTNEANQKQTLSTLLALVSGRISGNHFHSKDPKLSQLHSEDIKLSEAYGYFENRNFAADGGMIQPWHVKPMSWYIQSGWMAMEKVMHHETLA